MVSLALPPSIPHFRSFASRSRPRISAATQLHYFRGHCAFTSATSTTATGDRPFFSSFGRRRFPGHPHVEGIRNAAHAAFAISSFAKSPRVSAPKHCVSSNPAGPRSRAGPDTRKRSRASLPGFVAQLHKNRRLPSGKCLQRRLRYRRCDAGQNRGQSIHGLVSSRVEEIHSQTGPVPVKLETLPQGVRLAVEAAPRKESCGHHCGSTLTAAGAFTEYFVVCTGFSTPHVQAICTEIEAQLYKKLSRSPEHREGTNAPPNGALPRFRRLRRARFLASKPGATTILSALWRMAPKTRTPRPA